MTIPLELTLVRHGATAWNEGGRWQGWSDIPLGPLGEQQARELGAAWQAQGKRFDVAYSSDLLRARQTAEIALPGVPIRLDTRLREFNFGDYEGFTVPEMQAHPDYARWQSDPWQQTVPAGDSLSALGERLQGWLDDLPAVLPAVLPAGGRVVAFSHSIAIRTLLVQVLGLPLVAQENYPIPYAERVKNGQPITLRRAASGGWERII